MRTHRWRQRIYEKAYGRNSTKQNHEDHTAGSGIDSLNHYSLVCKFILMPQTLKIPDAKAAVRIEWTKLEKIPALQLTKVRNKKEVIDEARSEGKTVQFASLIWQHFRNAKVELSSEVTLCKMIQAHTQYVQSKVHQRHKWRQQK